MNRTLIFVAIAGLAGCASIPGSNAWKAERSQKAQSTADRYVEAAGNRRDEFVSCMQEYAKKRSASASTATEIANAGLSECQGHLDAFFLATRTAMQFQWIASTVGTGAEDRSLQEAEPRARDVTDSVRERGRLAAIKVVVDART